jgi:hypothetical protein
VTKEATKKTPKNSPSPREKLFFPPEKSPTPTPAASKILLDLTVVSLSFMAFE